jgi:hypothetical protein
MQPKSAKAPKPKKLPTARIPAALIAHDHIQSVSDVLRQRVGLAPVAENQTVVAWRTRVGGEDGVKNPTLIQWREIATTALGVLDLPVPANRTEAVETIGAF